MASTAGWHAPIFPWGPGWLGDGSIESRWFSRACIDGALRPANLKKPTSNLAAERNVSAGKDAVLVSVDDVNIFQRAYPNYFLDTTMFRSSVQSRPAAPIPSNTCTILGVPSAGLHLTGV